MPAAAPELFFYFSGCRRPRVEGEGDATSPRRSRVEVDVPKPRVRGGCPPRTKGFGDRRSFLCAACVLRSIEKHKQTVTVPAHRKLRRSPKLPVRGGCPPRTKCLGESTSTGSEGARRAHGGFGESTSTGSVFSLRLPSIPVEWHACAGFPLKNKYFSLIVKLRPGRGGPLLEGKEQVIRLI